MVDRSSMEIRDALWIAPGRSRLPQGQLQINDGSAMHSLTPSHCQNGDVIFRGISDKIAHDVVYELFQRVVRV
jgi:hypothetical protein